MKLTKKWLTEKNACKGVIEWFINQNEKNVVRISKKLIDENKLEWCNWLLSRWLPKIDKIRYAVFAAEQVIGIFEKRNPNDNRPRNAINSALNYIKNPDAAAATNAVAYAAADAAAAANAVADAAAYAAHAAAHATYAAAAADDATTYVVAHATHSAYAAAYVAADDAAYAANKMRLSVLNYGISLLKEELN